MVFKRIKRSHTCSCKFNCLSLNNLISAPCRQVINLCNEAGNKEIINIQSKLCLICFDSIHTSQRPQQVEQGAEGCVMCL